MQYLPECLSVEFDVLGRLNIAAVNFKTILYCNGTGNQVSGSVMALESTRNRKIQPWRSCVPTIQQACGAWLDTALEVLCSNPATGLWSEVRYSTGGHVILTFNSPEAVSYKHQTLPTNREV